LKKLSTLSVIAVMVMLSMAGYMHRDLVFNKIDKILTSALTSAVAEPEPILLHEALELPLRPGEDELLAVNDMHALALQITAGAATDYQRMVAVYDWITANFEYDLEKLADIDAYGSGAAYLLQAGKGICHDFAELALALFTALGIEATYESGDVFPAEGIVELHAWNHVQINGIWYAMDTTWGAGFIVKDENRFIQKSRRLYLTTPEELSRLHRDPAYKEEREMAYRRTQAVKADPFYLSGYEQDLLKRFNNYRADRGLPLLTEERPLLETVRQAAARIAAQTATGEEYTLDELKRQIEQRASVLRIKKVSIYSFVQWDFEHPSSAQLFEQIVQDQVAFLGDAHYRAATVAVVRQGDITVAVHVYLILR